MTSCMSGTCNAYFSNELSSRRQFNNNWAATKPCSPSFEIRSLVYEEAQVALNVVIRQHVWRHCACSEKKNASSECQQPQQYIIHAHDHSAANRGISAYNSVEVKKHQRSKCGMAMPIEMRSKIPRRFCIKLFLYPSHSLREALGSLSRVSPAAITLENYDADVFLEFNWISSRNRQGGLPSYQK